MKLVFAHVVKGIKIKITATFRALRRICFEDTKIIIPSEMRPKVSEKSEKRAPGVLEAQWLEHPSGVTDVLGSILMLEL